MFSTKELSMNKSSFFAASSSMNLTSSMAEIATQPAVQAVPILARQASAPARESALSWPTILSFSAILFSAVQGTLGMESASPCRISYSKLILLVGLELAEVAVVFTSEIFQLVQMRRALQFRLQWLHWLPPCLLVMGLLEMYLDVYVTLTIAQKSRTRWQPFGSFNPFQKNPIRLVIVGYFSTTTSLSIFLAGWRQKWWHEQISTASAEDAINAAEEEVFLSNYLIGVYVGFGLSITIAAVVGTVTGITRFLHLILPTNLSFSLSNEGEAQRSRHSPDSCQEPEDSWIRSVRHMFHPHDWVTRKSPVVRRSGSRSAIERQCKLLIQLQTCADSVDAPMVERYLEEAPLHVGNVIIGEDCERVLEGESKAFNAVHAFILLAEPVSTRLLLSAVAGAVIRLWNKLDEETSQALEELVDALIILGFLEIGIGLKNFLWSNANQGSMSQADIPLSERVERHSDNINTVVSDDADGQRELQSAT